MSRPEPETPGQKHIYALVDPRSLVVRYVGQSTDPLKRLSLHLAPRSLKVENARNRWLRELLSLSLRPICVILQTPAPERWADAERAWIVQGRMIGWELVNTSDGGEGVLEVTPETYIAQAQERASQKRAAPDGKPKSPKGRRKRATLSPRKPASAPGGQPAVGGQPALGGQAGKGDSASLARASGPPAGEGNSPAPSPGPPPQKPSRAKSLPPLPPGISRRPVERRQKR